MVQMVPASDDPVCPISAGETIVFGGLTFETNVDSYNLTQQALKTTDDDEEAESSQPAPRRRRHRHRNRRRRARRGRSPAGPLAAAPGAGPPLEAHRHTVVTDRASS